MLRSLIGYPGIGAPGGVWERLWSIFGFCFLLERHDRRPFPIQRMGCCSYCDDAERERIGARWRLALWLPERKVWNSWRVIVYRGERHNWYLRWTLPRRSA